MIRSILRASQVLALACLSVGPAFASDTFCVSEIPVIWDMADGETRLLKEAKEVGGSFISVREGAFVSTTWRRTKTDRTNPQPAPPTAFWAQLDAPAFQGPHFLDSVIQFYTGRYASHGSSTYILDWEIVAENPRRTERRLLTLDAQNIPVAASIPSELAKWDITKISASHILGGYLIAGTGWDEERKNSSGWGLWQEDNVTALGHGRFSGVSDLPNRDVAAMYYNRAIRIVDRALNIYTLEIPHLHNDDLSVRRIYETADDDWLFMDSFPETYALKLEREDGGWRLSEANSFDRRRVVFRSAIGRAVNYEEMTVLQDGQMVPISNDITLTKFVGDIESARKSVLLGADDRLYTFDGHKLMPIGSGRVEKGEIRSVEPGSRAFYITRREMMELVANGDEYDLKTIHVFDPPETAPISRRVLTSPGDSGDPLLFSSKGIAVIEPSGLRFIWHPSSGDTIRTTSHTAPLKSNKWNGIVFTTRTTIEGPSKYFLLTACQLD